MVANNNSWQAGTTPGNFTPMYLTENKLAVIKKNATTKQVSVKMKVVAPKRYSFDDNGGGYKGL